jgi:hypothetical protein
MLTTESQDSKKAEEQGGRARMDHQTVPAFAAGGRGGTAVP